MQLIWFMFSSSTYYTVVFQAIFQKCNRPSCVLLVNLIIAIAKQDYVLIVPGILVGNRPQSIWYDIVWQDSFTSQNIHRLYEGRKAEKDTRFVNSYCISYSGVNNNNILKKSKSFWKAPERDKTLLKIILNPKRTFWI